MPIKIVTRVMLLVFLIAALAFTMNLVLAASFSFSGSVTTSDTAMTDCATNYARIVPFTVDTTASYTLTNTGPAAPFNGPGFYYVSVLTTIPTYISANPDRLFIINNAGASTASGSLTANVTYYLVFGGSAGCGTTYPVNYAFTFAGLGNIIFPSTPTPPVAGAEVEPSFTDGRINRFDRGAPVVVYPILADAGFGLAIYDAYGENRQLLFINPEDIALTDRGAENTLIAADEQGRVSVYRLTDGTFQVNARMSNGKLYVLNFAQILPNVAYTSVELD